MSAKDEKDLAGFERRLREVLAQSVEGVDARVRSRLNQARQGAVARPPRPRWAQALSSWMPALGAVTAALLVALLVGLPRPLPPAKHAVEAAHPTMEDMDLLADDEGMDLIQSVDFTDGSFYEWATSQADGSEAQGTGV